MKRLLILAGVILSAATGVAQNYNKENNFGFGPGFLKSTDALDYLIPSIELPPTKPTVEDSLYYVEGLRIRKEDRTRTMTAARDAVWNIEALCSWSDAVGIELSANHTPAIWYLVSRAVQDSDNLVLAIKEQYYRQRPYPYFEEEDDGVADRDRLRETSSCPSGHSSLSGVICALLLELFPEKAAAIIQRGSDFRKARWVLGFHWRSDTDLGWNIGFYVVTILHSNQQFLLALQSAKYEVARLSSNTERASSEDCFHRRRPYE